MPKRGTGIITSTPRAATRRPARAISPNHARVAFLTAQIGAQRRARGAWQAQRAAAGGDVSAALAWDR
jgi:hypothetical protein